MSKLLLNIPHSSTNTPYDGLASMTLGRTNAEILHHEYAKMTDSFTDKLFSSLEEDRLVASVSRLVCDVERFRDDQLEPMSKLGMGAVYTKTSTGEELRVISDKAREALLVKYYDPYHAKFHEMVADKLVKHDSCVILDCHSFDESMSYTNVEPSEMPDFCIGTDDFHTPTDLVDLIKCYIVSQGYSVGINTPFSGSIVPLNYYNKDKRVKSVMLEVNKKLYISELHILDDEHFASIKEVCDGVVSFISDYKVVVSYV